jgi:RNA polymerase sigma factor (sigma-70 family)
LEEKEFLQDLKKGNREAFQKLVNAYSEKVYNISLSYLNNFEDAEDLTQEVFIEVYNSISKFRGDSKLSTWIYRITINKSLDFLKRKKSKKRFAFVTSIFSNEDVEEEIPDFEHPGILLESKERAKILFSAVSKLPDSQKTAFMLNKIDGLSYKEISEIMDTSISSVESLLFRAKENLRKLLNTYYNR